MAVSVRLTSSQPRSRRTRALVASPGKGTLLSYLDSCTHATERLYQTVFNDLPLSISAHIVPYSVVIQESLDAAHSADRHILIPQLPPRPSHYVLLADASYDSLHLFRVHTAAGGDDLTTNVLSNSGGTVKGEEDGRFELSLCALGFGFRDVVGKAGPFAESKVNEIVDLGLVLCDEVDTP